jgi:hypothetical protein
MFKENQKVICINADYGCINGETIKLKEIYTVTKAGYKEETAYHEAYYYLNLKEITGAWAIERFRPLDESFAEETLEMIKEQIEEEYLVLK